MNSEAFLTLATTHAKNTNQVRICTKTWSSSGVSQIRDEVTKKIGSIIALLEDKAKEFCTKDEFLMVYNFQPLSNTLDWCCLDIVIRPQIEISDLGSYTGKGFQLGIDGNSGQVVNNAYVLQEMGIEDDDAQETEGVCYGNFFDYADPKSPANIQNSSDKFTTVTSPTAVLFSTRGTTLSETKRSAETVEQTEKKTNHDTMINHKNSTKSNSGSNGSAANRSTALTFAYDLNTNNSFSGLETCIADSMISPSAMLAPFDCESNASEMIAKMASLVYCQA